MDLMERLLSPVPSLQAAVDFLTGKMERQM